MFKLFRCRWTDLPRARVRIDMVSLQRFTEEHPRMCVKRTIVLVHEAGQQIDGIVTRHVRATNQFVILPTPAVVKLSRMALAAKHGMEQTHGELPVVCDSNECEPLLEAAFGVVQHIFSGFRFADILLDILLSITSVSAKITVHHFHRTSAHNLGIVRGGCILWSFIAVHIMIEARNDALGRFAHHCDKVALVLIPTEVVVNFVGNDLVATWQIKICTATIHGKTLRAQLQGEVCLILSIARQLRTRLRGQDVAEGTSCFGHMKPTKFASIAPWRNPVGIERVGIFRWPRICSSATWSL